MGVVDGEVTVQWYCPKIEGEFDLVPLDKNRRFVIFTTMAGA